MNSREKGKRGELELAKILRSYGYDCRRGQQYCGANGDADVVGLPGVHIECKRVEDLNLTAAMRQSIADAVPGKLPVVMHRKNGGKWKVTMMESDLMEMVRKAGTGLPVTTLNRKKATMPLAAWIDIYKKAGGINAE